MGKKDDVKEVDPEDVQVVIDYVSDERAWCMFGSTALPTLLALNAASGAEATVSKDAIFEQTAVAADKMLALFKARFRSEEGGEAAADLDNEEEDEDDDDDDD